MGHEQRWYYRALARMETAYTAWKAAK